MFAGVNEKLERAGYFLNNLKTLAQDAGGFTYIKTDKQQAMRANLDGFFFEVISAKDFFLQGINDRYGAVLPKDKATDIGQLKGWLSDANAFGAVTSIEKLLSKRDSWLWRLNNYRNAATHRELLHMGHEVEVPPIEVEKDVFDKIRQRGSVIKPIFAGQEKEIPPDVPKVNIPRENIKTYLFKDPEDPSQGNADIEVIPYCEQSLKQMTEFLEKLYSKL